MRQCDTKLTQYKERDAEPFLELALNKRPWPSVFLRDNTGVSLQERQGFSDQGGERKAKLWGCLAAQPRELAPSSQEHSFRSLLHKLRHEPGPLASSSWPRHLWESPGAKCTGGWGMRGKRDRQLQGDQERSSEGDQWSKNSEESLLHSYVPQCGTHGVVPSVKPGTVLKSQFTYALGFYTIE